MGRAAWHLANEPAGAHEPQKLERLAALLGLAAVEAAMADARLAWGSALGREAVVVRHTGGKKAVRQSKDPRLAAVVR